MQRLWASCRHAAVPLHVQSHGQYAGQLSHTQVWCCNTTHQHQTLVPLLPALQVYAYTTSDLQTAVLKMFTRAECRLPNLYVGLLTRESVSGALTSGITAHQVVQYLRQHAHPQVQGRSPMVPEVGSNGIVGGCAVPAAAHTCAQLLGMI